MNIKKEISRKNVGGKCQILVRADISRTVRPSLKTGIFIRPELFDAESGNVTIPRQSRRNADVVKEAEEGQRLLQSFCVTLLSICQEKASELEVCISKEWLQLQLSSIVQHNNQLTNAIPPIAAAKAPKNKTAKLVPVETSIFSPDTNAPRYEKQDFYRLLILYCEWNNISESRTRCYKTLARQLRRFELYQQAMVSPSFVLNYDSLTSDDLEAFRVFVRNEAELKKKHETMFKRFFAEAPYTCNEKKPKTIGPRSENYISNIMKRLAAVFHWLQHTKKTKNNPFESFNVGQEIYGDPIYLNKEERDALANYDLKDECVILQQQRDIFIFQCLVGCRVGDLLRFTPDNINGDVLEYVPVKTSKRKGPSKSVRVTLNLVAVALVELYRGVDRKDRLFPFISAAKYNERIKEVFRVCGITRVVQYRNPVTGQYESRPICDIVSSHMARRTFIGVAYRLTHDPNLIGKMTGHVEGSQAFNRYRKIEDEDLRSVANLL